MSVRIRVTATPPGIVSPLQVRQAWVGLELPATPNVEEDEWTGEENIVGYVVSKVDVIEALLGARRKSAADFWVSMTPIKQFVFDAKDCEVIEA